MRRTKALEAALPWLYLKGVSSGEMGATLKVLLGPDAAGLSANTVSRLKRCWAAEYDGWRETALDDEPISISGLAAFIAAFEARTTSCAPL